MSAKSVRKSEPEIESQDLNSQSPQVTGRLSKIAGNYQRLEQLLSALEVRLPPEDNDGKNRHPRKPR